MSLHNEKAAALAEVLAATGEEIVWKGRTLHALVSDNPLSQDLGLGGFAAKGDCTMKVLRSELGADRPKLGERVAFQDTTYRHMRHRAAHRAFTQEAAHQLQFLLNGQTITQVRENIRAVNIVARSAGPERLDPTKLENFTLTTRNGKPIPLSQIGRVEIQSEDPHVKRRDRVPTITVRGDNIETTQPPDISSRIWANLAPLRRALPENYRIEMAGSIEEAKKANSALAPLFPIMLLLMLAVIIIQVRSFSAMWMVMLTGPLGLIGAVPALLIFQQPFGFNAILGLIGLSGILMRNTLILIGQVQSNQADGLDRYQAIIEATVQRSRPVILTALAAVLAFIPLTHSVFWGSMAYVLIGGTAVGTVLTLAFLPALYAIWFRVSHVERNHTDIGSNVRGPVTSNPTCPLAINADGPHKTDLSRTQIRCSLQSLAERVRGLPRLFVADVGVADGRADILVAEELLDFPQILSHVVKQDCGGAVA